MSQQEAGYFIVGITDNGKKFRPSDWVQRIASVCGCFDVSHRLHYNPMLKPIKYDGLHGLFVAGRLATLNPEAYNYAMEFAYSNHLEIINIGMTDSLPQVA